MPAFFQLLCFNVYSAHDRGAQYCDECICLSVCLSVCVFVCPQSYLQNYTSDLHQLFVRVTHGRGSVLLWRHSDDCLADKREDRQNCSVMPACCLGAYVSCIYITAKTFFTFNVCYF